MDDFSGHNGLVFAPQEVSLPPVTQGLCNGNPDGTGVSPVPGA